MRFKSIMIAVALLLRNRRYTLKTQTIPRLTPVAKVEIPTFNYVDMVGRMSRIDTSYTPPASPPKYTLGDTQTFTVTMGKDEKSEQVEMELRGQTQRVLIWI